MKVPSTPPWRLRTVLGSLRLGLLSLLVAVGCCVTPPTVDELLSLGYRTPEHAFHTFQMGMAGDYARVEYACFSTGFRRRIGSQLGYREFREEWMKQEPLLRWGVVNAKILGSQPLGPDRVRLTVMSEGGPAFAKKRVDFAVEMVREDYSKVWAGDDLLSDELLTGGFKNHVEVDHPPDGTSIVYVGVPVSITLDASEISEVRIGREWKIDSIQRTDP